LLSKIGGTINVAPGERVGSTVAGIALLLNALIRRGPLSILGGLLGVGLLSRGVTGHCPVYDKLGLGMKGSGAASKLSESTPQARSVAPIASNTAISNPVSLGATGMGSVGTIGAASTTGSVPLKPSTLPKSNVEPRKTRLES
jgi:hypothetical protein